VPEVFLMLGVFAANRWAIVVPMIVFEIVTMAWVSILGPPPSVPDEEQSFARSHLVWVHPMYSPNRFHGWAGCFARDGPGELWTDVAFQAEKVWGIDWAQLEEVEAFLRSQGMRAGDDTVMCWHDSTHPLYLTLHLHPPIRFMHLSTATGIGDAPYQWVKEET